MFLEVATEEADICKMVFPGYLLDALRGALELHLELEDDVLLDDGLRGMPRYLAHDVGEILGGNVHQIGIIVDIPRLLVVSFHQHHKPIEEFSHSI